MRILLVSAVIDPELGGPAAVLQRHVAALRGAGVEVWLFGVAAGSRLPWMRQLYPDARLFPLVAPKRWFRGAGLRAALQAALPHCDLVHAHMLWDHSVWAAWRVARQLEKPLIVTPHGSLMEPWRYRSLHKRLYRRLVLEPMLRETSFLHLLSHQEESACREAGLQTPMRVVPNGLDDQELQAGGDRLAQQQWARQARSRWPTLAHHQVMLFLGRLWEGKGVMDLVEAWAGLLAQPVAQGWMLVVAGPDYQGGRQRLEERVRALGIQERVLLTGPVFGNAKAELLAVADGFVLPSRSEGASMALLEAMAAGVGVVLTRECHFPALAQAAGGIEVAMGVEGITGGMAQWLGMDPQARAEMGCAARTLANSRYAMSTIVQELIALYRDATVATCRKK